MKAPKITQPFSYETIVANCSPKFAATDDAKHGSRRNRMIGCVTALATLKRKT